MATPTMRVEVGLASYRAAVLALSPLAYWPLGDVTGTTAEDVSGNSRDGVYVNAPTLRVLGPLPEGGGAVTLNGSDEKVTVASGALDLTAGPLSVSAWVKLGTGASDAGIAGTGFSSGYQLNWHVGLVLYFYIGTGADSASYAFAGTGWHHVVGTWDGSTGANGIKLYLDGALVAQGTAATTVLTSTGFQIGQSSTYFDGSLAAVSVHTTALSLAQIQTLYAAGSWTNIAADTVGAAGLHVKYGIDGNGPLDRVASTGELTYQLRNDAGNSGGLQGYYSPSHTNVRSGFTFGIPCRVTFTFSGTTYTKFTGKIRVIGPEPGQYLGRKVNVVAYDVIRDLAETNAREVTIQVDQAEDELLAALLAVVPDTSGPAAIDFDAGVDTYPYSFDRVAGDTPVLSAARDVVVSSLGLLFVTGDGTLCYRSRHTLATGSSDYSFSDTMHDLSVPSTLDGVFNRVRVTTHPKSVSAAATEELYTLPTGSSLEIPASSSVEVWTAYSDPNDRQTKVGGTSVVTSLVAGTHYVANAAADGSGVNLNSFITATLEPFGSTAKWTLANSHSSSAYLTTQKVVGKAIRDPGPQTFEAYSVKTYGDRPVEIDLPNQDDPYLGQSAADFLITQYSALDQQVESITFVASKSDALMTQALAREPGDRITVTETVSGLSAVAAVITSVELEVLAGIHVICRWGLSPANTTQFWQWGVAGASEWGETTVYGF